MKQEKKGRSDLEVDLVIMFSMFDHSGDGFITAGELEESLKRLSHGGASRRQPGMDPGQKN